MRICQLPGLYRASTASARYAAEICLRAHGRRSLLRLDWQHVKQPTHIAHISPRPTSIASTYVSGSKPAAHEEGRSASPSHAPAQVSRRRQVYWTHRLVCGQEKSQLVGRFHRYFRHDHFIGVAAGPAVTARWMIVKPWSRAVWAYCVGRGLSRHARPGSSRSPAG